MLKRPAELSQLGLIFRLASPMQGALCGGTGKGVLCLESWGWLRGCRDSKAFFWEQPLPGGGCAPGRLPSPGCTCGWGSEGCSSQGVKASSSWEDGPGRALLGPWPGLLVKLPRMVLAIAASSICLGKISLCVLPPADATAPREGRAPKPSQQEQQNPRQPKSRNTAGTRFGF